MHVMMAIEPAWSPLVEATKLINLGSDHVFERARQSRVVYSAGKAMPPEVRGDFPLMLGEQGGAVLGHKWGCQVEMQSRIDPFFLSNCCGPLRILHEYHRADRRDGTTQAALEYPFSVLAVLSPIVGVYDECTGFGRYAVGIRKRDRIVQGVFLWESKRSLGGVAPRPSRIQNSHVPGVQAGNFTKWISRQRQEVYAIGQPKRPLNIIERTRLLGSGQPFDCL